MRLTSEELAARKRRNAWLAFALVAFMVLVFTTTFLRMRHNQQAARDARAAQAPVAAAPAEPTAVVP
jgi:hypothetical protein